MSSELYSQIRRLLFSHASNQQTTSADPKCPFYYENPGVPHLAESVLSLLRHESNAESAAFCMLLAFQDEMRLAERDGRNIPADVTGPYLKAYDHLLNSCCRGSDGSHTRTIDVFSWHLLSRIIDAVYLGGDEITVVNQYLVGLVLKENAKQQPCSVEDAFRDSTSERVYAWLCEIPEHGKHMLLGLMVLAHTRVSLCA